MSAIKPINEKARSLRRAGGEGEAAVRACAPLPSECTTLHAPGIETGYDNKTGKKLCNPYIRDVWICYMWPGQVPGNVYGMNTEVTLPQNVTWHTLCSNWKDDWDKLPAVVTLQQPTDQPTPDALWDSAVKVRTPGQQGYDYLSDLRIRDNWADTGVEPSPGNFWESPDIFFRHAPDDPAVFNDFNTDYHLDPIATKENWVYARIHNIGQQPIIHAFVKFYIAYPWSANPSWRQIGHGMAHRILPGEVRVVRAERPYVPPFATSHACLLAMVDSNQDFIKVVDWGSYDEAKGPTPEVINVRDDNNVAQRNIKVVAAAFGLSDVIEKFALGTLIKGPRRGVFDLEIDRGTLPRDIPIAIGFANVRPEALERAALGEGVRLREYSNVIYPWNLRSFEQSRTVAMTYAGLIPRIGRRPFLENIESAAGRPSRVGEERLASLRPIRVTMPGIMLMGVRVGYVRDLELAFQPGEPLMAELKIELPGEGEVAEHHIVIRQFQQRRLLGGITLVLRLDRGDNFMFFLDLTTGLIHRSGSPTLKGLRRRNLFPLHTPDRALPFGAQMAEEE